ncbi:MAG: class II aldolase, partial [Micrococcales bacterium]
TSTAQAVAHTHAPASTALGLVVDEVPLSHYYSAMFGGPIRVAPYATYGTDQLATVVTEALRGRTGALMANHGAVTTAGTLKQALSLLEYLEYVCEIQLRAMATGLPVKTLPEREIAVVAGLLQNYGQQTGTSQ